MSKLTQIENELQSINPAGFHRLCDLYLRYRGYDCVNPVGIMLEAYKDVKGTPDTLIMQADGT